MSFALDLVKGAGEAVDVLKKGGSANEVMTAGLEETTGGMLNDAMANNIGQEENLVDKVEPGNPVVKVTNIPKELAEKGAIKLVEKAKGVPIVGPVLETAERGAQAINQGIEGTKDYIEETIGLKDKPITNEITKQPTALEKATVEAIPEAESFEQPTVNDIPASERGDFIINTINNGPETLDLEKITGESFDSLYIRGKADKTTMKNLLRNNIFRNKVRKLYPNTFIKIFPTFDRYSNIEGDKLVQDRVDRDIMIRRHGAINANTLPERVEKLKQDIAETYARGGTKEKVMNSFKLHESYDGDKFKNTLIDPFNNNEKTLNSKFFNKLKDSTNFTAAEKRYLLRDINLDALETGSKSKSSLTHKNVRAILDAPLKTHLETSRVNKILDFYSKLNLNPVFKNVPFDIQEIMGGDLSKIKSPEDIPDSAVRDFILKQHDLMSDIQKSVSPFTSKLFSPTYVNNIRNELWDYLQTIEKPADVISEKPPDVIEVEKESSIGPERFDDVITPKQVDVISEKAENVISPKPEDVIEAENESSIGPERFDDTKDSFKTTALDVSDDITNISEVLYTKSGKKLPRAQIDSNLEELYNIFLSKYPNSVVKSNKGLVMKNIEEAIESVKSKPWISFEQLEDNILNQTMQDSLTESVDNTVNRLSNKIPENNIDTNIQTNMDTDPELLNRVESAENAIANIKNLETRVSPEEIENVDATALAPGPQEPPSLTSKIGDAITLDNAKKAAIAIGVPAGGVALLDYVFDPSRGVHALKNMSIDDKKELLNQIVNTGGGLKEKFEESKKKVDDLLQKFNNPTTDTTQNKMIATQLKEAQMEKNQLAGQITQNKDMIVRELKEIKDEVENQEREEKIEKVKEQKMQQATAGPIGVSSGVATGGQMGGVATGGVSARQSARDADRMGILTPYDESKVKPRGTSININFKPNMKMSPNINMNNQSPESFNTKTKK